MAPRSIFVLMPFSAKFDNIFYALETAANRLGVRIERADKPPLTEAIVKRIYDGIKNADLVLADLTEMNANVYYEVGSAHASGKPVVLISTSMEHIAFNLRGYPIHVYAPNKPMVELIGEFATFMEGSLKHAVDTAHFRGPLQSSLRAIENMPLPGELFGKLAAARLSELAVDVMNITKGTIRVGPAEARQKGIELLKSLSDGGFATFFVPVESFWLTDKEYLDAARSASRDRGANISRVYLTFEESSLDSEGLRDCIEADERAGINAFICAAGRLTDREALKDFGIWDDTTLCIVEIAQVDGQTTVTGCTFTTDPAELRRAARWRTAIMGAAEPASRAIDRSFSERPPRQPLVASASVMRTIADDWCHGSYLNHDDCGWYHSSWQFLRLVDIVSTPDWHADFYRTTFDDIRDGTPKRVLICGTADYAMLAHVVAATAENADVEVVVADMCQTPLRICEWYADRYGLKNVRTLQADALSLDFRDEWFDIVVTDAFLTRFTKKDRIRVVREWVRVLARGGSIVTTARLDESKVEAMRASDEDARLFEGRARQRAASPVSMIPVGVDVGTMASAYARHMVSYPVTEAEIRGLFRGLRLRVSKHETPGEYGASVYAQVFATRRNEGDELSRTLARVGSLPR